MIPVYFINGFLESGKTSFLNYTLEQEYFMDGQKTLLIVCEEGIEEFDENKLKKDNVIIEYIEEESDFTTQLLNDLAKKHKPERVIIEYNGMWKMDTFRKTRPPFAWKMEQMITTIDATTYPTYMANMKSLMISMVTDSDMIIFNRCTDEMPLEQYRRALRAVNRTADYIFEDENGEIDKVFDEDLPYDLNADVIKIADDDYMIFYIDMLDRADRYNGKIVEFMGCVLKAPDFPKNLIVPGRMVMTCCADDIQFAGCACWYDKADAVNNEEWVIVTAEVKYEEFEMYGGVGPVLYAKSVKSCKAPKNKVLNMA